MGFLNPNELFSGFKDKVMSTVGGHRPGPAKDLIKQVGRGEMGKDYNCYPSDILSANSEVTKAIQFNALMYNWKRMEGTATAQGDREGGGTLKNSTHLWTCFLPIPAISTTDGHIYSEFNGWGLGEAINKAPGAFKKIGEAFTNPSGDSALGALNAASDVAAPLAVRKAYEFAQSTFGDEMNVLRRNIWNGATVNPLTSVIYTNSSLKTYNFEFILVARNKEETKQIHSIVTHLQSLSRPSTGRGEFLKDLGLDIHVDYLTHPSLWEIKFVGEGTDGSKIETYLPKIKLCVMEGITISYQGDSNPVFFRATAAPVTYKVSMAFKEIYISTQEDV